jgi:hypothetical protein
MAIDRPVCEFREVSLTKSGNDPCCRLPLKSRPRPVNGWLAKAGPRCGPKSIFFKGHGSNILPMPVSARHIATFLALALASFALGGCGTINEKLADGMGTYVPQWAGGLPPDAPPRRGTPEYDAYMKEREAKRLQPAPSKDEATKAPSSSSAAVY